MRQVCATHNRGGYSQKCFFLIIWSSLKFEMQALQDLPGVEEAVVNKQFSTATAR